jgi:uncharacterized repeat protein (TIGR03803 family)
MKLRFRASLFSIAALGPLAMATAVGADARSTLPVEAVHASVAPKSPISALNNLNLVYAFPGGGSGQNPSAPLITDRAGVLYGTTTYGGSCSSGQGCGTVFALTPKGRGYAERVLYSFQGGADGSSPYAGLLADAAGNLYGTTEYGGTCSAGGNGCGTVFKLTPNGSGGYSETVLHTFQSGSDGALPLAGLIRDASGALYGTTIFGGSGSGGVVFKLAPNGSRYVERVLYAFRGRHDGEYPGAGLLADASGALYGTTSAGGGSSSCPTGCGTVFRLTPSGRRYAESVLYAFQGKDDGAQPEAAVIADASGSLYGTAYQGYGAFAWGTVFKLTPQKKGFAESSIYTFHGGTDGAFPAGSLLAAAGGAFYGTTRMGGSTTCGGSVPGCGTVFKLTPRAGGGYAENVLHAFAGGTDGSYPPAALIVGANGALLGTTFQGGDTAGCGDNPGCGSVFRLGR